MNFDKYVIDNDSNSTSRRGAGGDRPLRAPAAKFSSRSAALVEASTRLRGILAAHNETFGKIRSYTDLYNSWFNHMPSTTESQQSKTYGDDHGRRTWWVRRAVLFHTADGIVTIARQATDHTLKNAQNAICKAILSEFLVPQAQMDNTPSKESVQGDATQESSKDSNTIVTRDQSVTESMPTQHETTSLLASSEPTLTFDQLVGRWMPLKTIKVGTNKARDHVLATYYLPETFLSSMAKCAPNTIPFETFVYGDYDYEFKFVVNANKFQCGKVIVSAKFDSYQADAVQNGFQAHLSRPHVILDLSANNEGVLRVPFRYHRAFVRNLTHSTATAGVRPGKFASVYVTVLSPLRTGAGGANDMDIRPFYMIRRAQFAGMSYKVPLTQMDLDSLAQALPTKSLKAVLKGVEATLDQLGTTDNQDKPTDLRGMVVIPRPRLHFPSGKGISDASVMRMNPHALTSYTHIKPYPDDPRTTLDIARIWGLRSVFTWKESGKEGDELFNSIIDPTTRSYTEDYTGQPTPLEYVCTMYQFWSGPIELRFDFVSNSFHTGSVIISAEYNRTSTDTDECQSHATYTKTFHLGEQKSVMFRVPYIYDTVWRRNTGLVFNPLSDYPATSDAIKSAALSVRPESRMRVKVRVLNALRPVSATTSEIDVLVFMRASKTFAVHSLKPADLTLVNSVGAMDSFPVDSYKVTVPEVVKETEEHSRRRRDVKEEEELPVSTGYPHVVPPEQRYLPGGNKWNELPAVQMDSGEKENEDTTDNFSLGHSALGVQSLDSQVGIKDILRKPTLLFDNVKSLNVDKKRHTGYFIPLMPPSRMMQYVRTTDFVRTVGQTPQAHLMNLFRFWRGSMRYTIIVTSNTNGSPVYITHVPHSGTRLYSNKAINTSLATHTPIYGSGLTTEIIIPSVNPTACVEVPYDTENNWTLTFDENALRNYAWRDKGDTNMGHLVLTSSSSFTFTIWWHAGDDFQFANFYGIPEMTSKTWKYQWNDEHASVQMEDFQASNVLTSVNTLCRDMRNVLSPTNVAKAALFSVPYVGSGFAAASAVGMVNDVKAKAEHVMSDFQGRTSDAIDRVVNAFGVSVEGLMDVVKTTADRVLAGTTWAANVASHCYDVILDILIAWVDKSWTAIGVSVVRFVGKVAGRKLLASLMQYGVQLGEVLAQLARPAEITTQAPPRDHTNVLIGVLAGLVGTVVGVRVNMYRYTSLLQGVVARLTESGGMSYLVNVLRFVESTFSVIRESVLSTLGYVTPEAAALRMLSTSSEALNTFVTEAQLITCEANASMMLDPGFRQRFWKSVMQAYQIQKLLATAPPSSASPVLGKLCSDVIRMGNEKFVDISAAPVRYEPFVICIEGAAGIGKSDLVDALASSLLGSIDFQRPHSGITYYRMPGSKFWSGYRDQPIVVYDDWLNITDPVAAAQQLSELYQLKSTSLFIPEMANLEEKKIRGNPLIVILLCNDAFPRNIVSNLVSTSEAVYRRRDLLLRASKKLEYKDINPRNMTTEEQTTFAHLEFQKYKDQTCNDSLGLQAIGYEAMKNYTTKLFQRWHAQEQVKVKRRLDNTLSGMAGAGVEQLRIEDPFQLYYSVSNHVATQPENNQNAFLPSEVLAAEVARIAEIVSAHQNQPQEAAEIPPEPEDAFAEPTTQGPIPLITAITSSRAFATRAIRWTRNQIEKWVHTIFRSTRGSMLECNICMEQKPVFARCKNSLETTPHVMCQECYILARQHRHLTCPVCRGEDMEVIPIAEVARDMGTFALVSFRMFESAQKAADFLLNQFNGDYALVMNILWKAGVLFTASRFSDQPLEVFSALPLSRLIDAVDDAYTSTTQADDEPIFDPFTGENEPAPSTSEDSDVFVCELDEVKLEDICATTVESPLCGHEWLLKATHATEYKNGSFTVLREGGVVLVSEHPCQSPTCPFSAQDQQYLGRARQFYTSYMRDQRHTLRAHLRGFYSAGIQNRDRQLYFLSRVPEAVRPKWMKINEPLSQELTVLSTTSWWEKLGDFYSTYKTIIWSLAGVTAAIGGIMSIHSIFRATEPVAQYINYDHDRTHQVRRTVRTLQRVRPNRPHFQSSEGETPDLSDTVKRYIARNYVTVLIKVGGETRMLTACGIFSRKALMPRHYVKELRTRSFAGAEILIHPALLPHEVHTYTFDAADFIESDVTDLAIWTLPASFGMFKDIRKFLSKDADLEKAIATEATMMLAPCRKNPTLTQIALNISGVSASEVVRDGDGERFTAHDVLVYDYSQPGACGNLVMLDRTTRPIVAMHFAGIGVGRQGDGFGVILTQESIGEILQDTTIAAQVDDIALESIDEAKILLGEANVGYMGALPKGETVFLPKKSKIRPSLIQGKGTLAPLTQPCILDKSDSRYVHDITPLVAGCMKHGKLTRDFPSSMVQRAGQRLWDTYLSKLKPIIVKPKRLTYDQAVAGIDGIEYYDPIVLGTSAGYPWCTTAQKQKADYITIDHDAEGNVSRVDIDERILKVLREKEEKRKQGIVPFTPFVDTLKDERRKPEKLLKLGGTRVFCNPPLEFIIAMRQNFLHFTAAFMKNRFSMQHAVGINVNGTEWTQLARKLIAISPNNVCTIDYSNFGPGFNAVVAKQAYDLMIRWLIENVEGVDKLELDCIKEECLNSQHICINTVYYQKCGSPSGAPITTIINTLVNELLILIAWDHIMTGNALCGEKFSMEVYKENVALFCYGDDLIMSVSDKIKDVFNAKTVSEFFAQYDIVATDANKGATVVPYEPITRATFLKMHFRQHERYPHLWQSALDWTSINDTTQWVWESADYKKATYENAKAALMSAHGHGKHKFDTFKAEVNRALIMAKCEPVSITWEEIDDLFYPEMVY